MHELVLAPLLTATWQTFYMVFIASFFSISLGLLLGSCLYISKKSSQANHLLYRLLTFSINIIRSLPFIILMIAVIPLTRFVMGTTIGTNAAIIPLTIAAIPFYARICENALSQVSPGLTEAAHAMGASTSQVLLKVLLPESLPSLIRGATLTIIALIGYSAMAGVVGGGGLGELAINYGYQRFDILVMIETIILLILLVQFVQYLGDHLANHYNIKAILISCGLLSAICLISQCLPVSYQQENTLKVGVMSGWQEKVMLAAKKVALKDYQLRLQIVTFNDYVQPNTALNNYSIDANIFQHAPYLKAQVKARHYKITSVAKTFVYPMGFYSKRLSLLSDLKKDAIIAIPNDPSNEARALLLLQKANLIKLKPDVSTLATVNDIIANPLALQFKLLDAAQLPRILKDADLVAITNDFINSAHLSIQEALLKEEKDSLYANLIVAREDDEQKPAIRKLIAIMHSPQVVAETEKIFPNGAAIPAWGASFVSHSR